jgi:hypothetical protein
MSYNLGMHKAETPMIFSRDLYLYALNRSREHPVNAKCRQETFANKNILSVRENIQPEGRAASLLSRPRKKNICGPARNFLF